jgi:translation elongation factor EF-Tu-like GTPase
MIELADGNPKQSTETLADIRAYIDELLEHRQQPVDETELPDDVEPVDDGSGKGTLVKGRVKCGADCTCNEGRGHGPYLYRYFWEEGKLKSEYVGKA